MEHVGKNLKAWRLAQEWSQIRLARALPEPLTDGQMIGRYEKSSEWFGSTANGEWLVEQGAFSRDALPTSGLSGTVNVPDGPSADTEQAA